MNHTRPINQWHSVYGITDSELHGAEQKVLEHYGDIIDAPRPHDPSRSRATRQQRAAQFSPFAALTGFEEEIAEEERQTESWVEPGEEQSEMLNRKFSYIDAHTKEHPLVTAVYFEMDEKKSGGSYHTVHGAVKAVDMIAGTLILTDRTTIPIPYLWDLQVEGCDE
ncbi:MAG: hypothetical protein IJ225_01210 [Solobacterium sp.]|nr:hypothetical protein [Solobacterium sp.]